MSNDRQKLMAAIIEKFASLARNINSGSGFPFGDFMLRKQQIMILFYIFENKGSASVKSIAHFLRVTPGAVTQFVDALVKKKLVKREENENDRRSINIRLTKETEKKFNLFRRSYLANMSQAFEGLSDSELEIFIRLLGKVKNA